MSDDVKESNHSILQSVIIRLLRKKPFFAHIIQNLVPVFTDKVPTAGVFLALDTNLYINPDWFNNLSKKEQVSILEHEVYHLLHRHIIRCNSGEFDKELYNRAADIAINQHIQNLPEGALLPETFSLPENETTEFYYRKLKDYPNYKIKLACTLDDHTLWEKSKEFSKEVEKKLKEIIREAAEKSGLSAGDLTAELKREFNWIEEPPFNWRGLLNSYLYKATLKKHVRTKNKPNRRYGILHPGIKSSYDLIIGICIDLSGSIDLVAQEKFYSWLDHIKKTTPFIIKIVEFDSEVKRFYEYNSRNDVQIPVGGGGTQFGPPLKRISEEEVDLILIFTDGENGDSNLEFPKQDIVWVLFKETQKVRYPEVGKVVYICD